MNSALSIFFIFYSVTMTNIKCYDYSIISENDHNSNQNFFNSQNSNKNSLSSKMNPDFNNFKRTKSNNDDKNKRSRSPTSNTTTSGSDSESNNNKNNNNNKISNHNNPFIHLYYSHFNDGTLKDEYVKVKKID